MNSTAIKPEWMGLLRPFARPSSRKAIIQLLDTILPYGALILLMNLSIRYGLPAWVTLLLSIPAGAFMVRACLKAVPELQLDRPLTLASSVKAVRLNLWDEAAGRLIAFRELRPTRAIVLQ